MSRSGAGEGQVGFRMVVGWVRGKKKPPEQGNTQVADARRKYDKERREGTRARLALVKKYYTVFGKQKSKNVKKDAFPRINSVIKGKL